MTVASAIRAALDGFAPVWVSPSILQSSRFYLELLGEELRARAFLTADETGQELCLRPDMTAPACRLAMAAAPPLRRVAYEGVVFRRRGALSPRETEFQQLGLEALDPPGADAPAMGEAEAIAGALQAVRAAGFEPALRVGHAGVFASFCANVGLDPAWVNELSRAAARPGKASAALSAAAAGAAHASPLARALAGLEPDAAAAALTQLLDATGVTAVGARPVSAIAARLQAQAAFARAPAPTQAQCALLTKVLALSAAAEDAFASLHDCARDPAVADAAAVNEAIDQAEGLWRDLVALTRPPADAVFAPGLGRTVSFYDGFVFDLVAPALGPRESLGGGGRYDGLIQAIARDAGAAQPGAWRALGFALRPERIAEALGAGS